MAGGYQTVTLPDAGATAAAAAALRFYLISANDTALSACRPDPAVDLSNLEVISACRQVVAGTNYQLLFQATVPCSSAAVVLTRKLAATVFVPLPSSNELPRVTSVKEST